MIVLSFLLVASGPEALAKGSSEGDGPEKPFPTGLGLAVSVMPYYSTLSDQSLQNYAVSAALVYDFNSRLRLKLTFFTGEEMVATSNSRPVTGKLLLGAGSIGATYYFAYLDRLRFGAGAGFDLQTILNDAQKGYNGNGFHLSAGGEHLLDQHFTLGAGLLFKRCFYRSLVNKGNWSELLPRINDSWIGLTFGVGVHFD